MLLLVLACCAAVPASGYLLLDGTGDPYASGFLFVGTPAGVYAFDRGTGVWGRYTTANGLPGNEVRQLGLDDGILWVATDSGLASADVRVNDWQDYDVGWPVTGLAFDEDYVWAGGAGGLSRFDKYTEEWEQVAGGAVNGLVHADGFVWLATDSGVLRYDPAFRRLERTAAPGYAYRWVTVTPRQLWFASADRLVARDREGETWSTYPLAGVADTSAIGDTLLALAGEVLRYDPSADDWQPVVELRDVDGVHGISAGQGRLLAATGHGLLAFDWAARRPTWYTTANGLVADSLLDAYEDEGYLYAFGPGIIQYLDKQTDVWQFERVVPAAARRQALVTLDEAGGHLRLFPAIDLRLTGRAYYQESRNWSAGGMSRTDLENVNLSLIGRHESGRALSLYYDDSDKDQVLYGGRYRGNDGDLLHRANGGWRPSDYYELDLLPQFETFGGDAKLRFREHGLGLQGGRLQSRPESDFFSGRAQDKRATVRDIDYARRLFYALDGPLGPGPDTAFVDDLLPGTNSTGTRTGFTAGGITGDFDVLVRGTDYFLDSRRGIVQFTEPRGDRDVVVLRAGGTDMVLQSGVVRDRAMENVYLVGRDIVPGSFALAIRDTLGREQELAAFGLDADGDGRVDDGRLDHELGWLLFPDSRPFPREVYDDTLNVYSMDIGFRTESVFYFLSARPVVKGSDRVVVDGETMRRGSDYVIDYTSGVLLFLRDDIVTDFSEVDVRYSSVQRGADGLLASAQPTVAVAPGVTVAPGFSTVDGEELGHVSARVETGGEGARLRFVPQVAVNTGGALAQAHELVASVGVLSVNAAYRGAAAGFEDYGAGARRYGELRHSASLAAVVEPLADVRLDGTFRREYQEDSAGTSPVQYASVKASYINPDLPNGYVLAGLDRLPEHEQQRLKLNAGYEFELAGSRFRLGSTWQGVRREADAGTGELFEYTGDAGFSLRVPVSGDVRFRAGGQRGTGSRTERELRCRLNVDAVPGLYYTGRYDFDGTAWPMGDTGRHDVELGQSFYNTLNVAPGRWWSGLSIVNFTFGTGDNFDEHGRHAGALSLFVLAPVEYPEISSVNRATSRYGLVQVTPVAGLSVWAKRTLSESGLAWYWLPDMISTSANEIRVEYEPRGLGRLTGTWEGRSTRSYPVFASQHHYLEWTMPWTDRVRTKLLGSHRAETDDYGTGADRERQVQAGAELLYRLTSRSFATASVVGDRRRAPDGVVVYSALPGAGVSLNLLRFLYLQVDWSSDFELGGPATHTLSARVTGQL